MTVYFKTSRSADRFGETDLLLDSDIVFGKDIRTYAVTGGRFDRAVVRLTPGKATVTIAGGEVCPVLALATDRYDDTLVRRFCDEQTRQDFQNSDRSSDHERMLIYHTLNRMADILGLDDPDDIVDRHFRPEAFMPAPATPSLFGTEDDDDDDDPLLDDPRFADFGTVTFGAACTLELIGHVTVEAASRPEAGEKAVEMIGEEAPSDLNVADVHFELQSTDTDDVLDCDDGSFEVSVKLVYTGEIFVDARDEDEAFGIADDSLAFSTTGFGTLICKTEFAVEEAYIDDIEWL